MESTTLVIITLVAYKLLLVAIGFWASRRNRDEADFFLGEEVSAPWSPPSAIPPARPRPGRSWA